MKIKDLFDLREKLEARVNVYWTYWYIAIFAICGWFINYGFPSSRWQVASIVTGTFVFFLCNLFVILSTTRMAIGVRDEIKIKSKGKIFESKKLINALKEEFQWRLNITIILHVVVDILVITLILLIFFDKTKTK